MCSHLQLTVNYSSSVSTTNSSFIGHLKLIHSSRAYLHLIYNTYICSLSTINWSLSSTTHVQLSLQQILYVGTMFVLSKLHILLLGHTVDWQWLHVRYLLSLHKQSPHADWLGGETEALEGFSWRGGSERDTTGILMWSKPYICTLTNGEEVRTDIYVYSMLICPQSQS